MTVTLVSTVLWCVDCLWHTTTAFPLCLDELAEHDCEGVSDGGPVA